MLLALNLSWAFHLLGAARRHNLRMALRSPAVRGWILAQLALLAVYAPWAWLARDALARYEGTAERFELVTAVVGTLGALVAGDRAHPAALAFAAVGGGILALGVITLVARRANRALGFLLLYLSLPILLAVVASLSRPIFRERYFIVSLTPFCLLAGSALATAFQPGATSAAWVGRALGVAACAALGWTTYEANRSYLADWNNSRPSWRTVAQIAEQHHRDIAPERLFVVLNFPEPALSYYYPGPARVIVLPIRPLDEQVALRQVEQMVEAGIARVVLQEMKAPGWDGDGIAARALGTRYVQLVARPVDEWTVRTFGRRTPEELTPFNAVYSRTVTLSAAGAFANRHAELLEVALQWAGDPSALRGSEKVFVHVGPLGRRGRTVRQHDPLLVPEDLTGRVSLFSISLAGLDPGEYEVRVGIYDPELPDMLRWRTQDGDDLCVVGTFNLP